MFSALTEIVRTLNKDTGWISSTQNGKHFERNSELLMKPSICNTAHCDAFEDHIYENYDELI
jgi:hypothetical protein